MTGAAPSERRPLWTVANRVTVTRAVIGVAAGWLLFSGGDERVVVWLFAVAVALDWLDGQIARRRGQRSALGAFLDPTVDKVVMAAVYGAVAWQARSPVVWSLFVLGAVRDSVVTTERSRVYLATGTPFGADRLAKIKTCVQSLGGLTVLFYRSYVDRELSFSSPPVVALFTTVAFLSFVSWGRYATVVGGTVRRDTRRVAKGSAADQGRPALTTVKPNGMAGSALNLSPVNGVVKGSGASYDTYGAQV